MARVIPLSQGQSAIMDDEDYDWLMGSKWYAHRKPRGDGYYAARHTGSSRCKKIFMHREIMKTPEGYETDHVNGDGLDNRRLNLRTCSKSQNQHNQSVKRKGTSSKYKGVSYYKANGKWGVNLALDGKSLFFGLHDTEEEAARVYNEKAIELFGEFASLNIVGPDDGSVVHTKAEIERVRGLLRAEEEKR